MLVRLLYRTKATHPPFTFHDLEIMRDAPSRNKGRKVNGFLLRGERDYFQVLEGPKDQVVPLARRISRDSRQFGFLKLSMQQVAERLFDQTDFEMHMLDESDQELTNQLLALGPDSPEAVKLCAVRAIAQLALKKARLSKKNPVAAEESA